MESLDVGIIGGGITGLALGYYFSRQGHRAVIFEKNPWPGGLIGTVKICGRPLEKYYHHIFTSDKYTLELIEELNLSEQISWLESSIAAYLKGKNYPFSTSLDLLKFPYLSPLTKLRLGLGTLYLQWYRDGEKLKNKRAVDWIKKYMGREAWQIVWQPLFCGKFGEYYQDIAMSWFWTRIHSRSAARFGQREMLGYPKNSYQEIIDRLVSEITKNKGQILINNPVKKLLIGKNQKITLMSSEGAHDFDVVLSTVAPSLLSPLLPDNFKDFKKELSQVVYLGNISTILILKEKLTDYYWTNILDRDIPFAGIIEHTNLVAPAKYKDKHIAYISHYTSSGSDYFIADDKNLLDKYLHSLRRINPKIDSILEEAFIFRDAYAQPVMTFNYPSTILRSQTPIKNLYQLSMAQIFPDDRGVNAAIREAKELVNFIISRYE